MKDHALIWAELKTKGKNSSKVRVEALTHVFNRFLLDHSWIDINILILRILIFGCVVHMEVQKTAGNRRNLNLLSFSST